MPKLPNLVRQSLEKLDPELTKDLEAMPLPPVVDHLAAIYAKSLTQENASSGGANANGSHAAAAQANAVITDRLKHLSHLPPVVKSALWLAAGELDRSHDISQSLETPEGSFLHGIMHRREGDFSNAKYWMRRVGKHEVFDSMARQHGCYSSPAAFVDFCQANASGQEQSAGEQTAKQVGWDEWCELMAVVLVDTGL